MKSTLQYLTNEAGERTAVVVAYAEWEALQRERRQLQHKLEVMQGIRQGLQEVREAKRTGRALPSLREFLDDAG